MSTATTEQQQQQQEQQQQEIRPRDLVDGQLVYLTTVHDDEEYLARVEQNQRRNGVVKITALLGAGGETEARLKYKEITSIRPQETGGTGAPSQESQDEIAKRVRAATAIEPPEKPAGYDEWAQAVHRGEHVEPTDEALAVYREYVMALWERHAVKRAENDVAFDVDLLEQVLRVAPDAAAKGDLADLARDVRQMRELRQQFNSRGLTETNRQKLLALEERFGVRAAKGDAKKPGGKGGGSKSSGRGKGGSHARAKYPDEITEAVRKAKEARGTKHGAPGAKQHVAVRAAVADASGMGGNGGVTAQGLLDYVGMSERQLKEAASGRMTTERLRGQEGLQRIAKLDAIAKDKKIAPWCKGRNLASMLVAWHGQLKEES